MTALHALGILSTSFTCNAFPTILKVFPYDDHLLAAFPSLWGPTHPKPSHLGWGRVIVEARSSDAALHHSPSWSISPYTAWRCVLGHCPVENKMIVPLSANQIGWRITAECCGSHAGFKVCLEFEIIDSVTRKAPPNHHTSSSMHHGGNHTCRDHSFTYSASHKDTAVGI